MTGEVTGMSRNGAETPPELVSDTLDLYASRAVTAYQAVVEWHCESGHPGALAMCDHPLCARVARTARPGGVPYWAGPDYRTTPAP